MRNTGPCLRRAHWPLLCWTSVWAPKEQKSSKKATPHLAVMVTNRMKNWQHKVNFLTIFSSFSTFFHLFSVRNETKHFPALHSYGINPNMTSHFRTRETLSEHNCTTVPKETCFQQNFFNPQLSEPTATSPASSLLTGYDESDLSCGTDRMLFERIAECKEERNKMALNVSLGKRLLIIHSYLYVYFLWCHFDRTSFVKVVSWW